MNIPQEDQLQSSKTPKRRKRNKEMCLEDRPVLEANAAGIDVGAREMFVAVPPGRDEHPVQVFATFTEDLERLADWLLLAIVDAILAGQRDATELAKLRDPHIKAHEETIRKSLVGNWRSERLFTLKQSRALYRTYQQLIVDCDLEIETMLRTFEPRTDPVERPLPSDRKRNRAGKKRRKKNGHPNPGVDLRTETYKLFGVDVTQIPGLEENALPLFSEVGRDMSKWPTAAHFVSWLALCPDNDISGGKLLWRGVRTVKNRAGHLFRLAAFSLHHSLTPLGNYLRRMKAKLGPRAATTATAHKIAVIFYTIVKNQVEYNESIWASRDAHREKRLEMKLKRQAKQLGYQLVPIEHKAA